MKKWLGSIAFTIAGVCTLFVQKPFDLSDPGWVALLLFFFLGAIITAPLFNKRVPPTPEPASIPPASTAFAKGPVVGSTFTRNYSKADNFFADRVESSVVEENIHAPRAKVPPSSRLSALQLLIETLRSR